MRRPRPLLEYPIKIGLPLLGGQFIADWLFKGLAYSASNLPERAAADLAVILTWAAVVTHRQRKKQTFR
jgi:hypothetical protein